MACCLCVFEGSVSFATQPLSPPLLLSLVPSFPIHLRYTYAWAMLRKKIQATLSSLFLFGVSLLPIVPFSSRSFFLDCALVRVFVLFERRRR